MLGTCFTAVRNNKIKEGVVGMISCSNGCEYYSSSLNIHFCETCEGAPGGKCPYYEPIEEFIEEPTDKPIMTKFTFKKGISGGDK